MSKTIGEMEIDNSQDWQKKHLKSIFYTYKKSRNFERNYPLLEKFYFKSYSLSEFLLSQLFLWTAEFKAMPLILKASDLDVTGQKSELIANICRRLGATTYLSGIKGKDYLDMKYFEGINVEYQEEREEAKNTRHSDKEQCTLHLTADEDREREEGEVNMRNTNK